MLDFLMPMFQFNAMFIQKLVEDIPDDRLAVQPVPGQLMNHGAFLLGHLAWASDNGIRLLGGEPQLAHLKDSVGMGAKPLPDRALYPSKQELLRLLMDARNRSLEAIKAAPAIVLDQPAPERMRQRFPTVRTMVFSLMTSHESFHVGQLSAWRRAMGFPSVF